MRIDPWSSTQYDYSRLREQFGIEEFRFDLPHPQKLFRRGVIFGHRGFDTVYRAIKDNKKFIVLTGLVPSGNMHLGHKMTIDQVIYYQSLGADIYIAVADIEAYGVRGISFSDAYKIAIEQYIRNYMALGLKKCNIYFQSKRKDVIDLAYIFGKKTNLSTMRAIYGFSEDTNMTHILAPLIQLGDILHVQLDTYSSSYPTVVPVGVDQDPHIRFSRDIAFAFRLYNVTETKDGRVGIFVKSDKNVNTLLNEAEKKCKELGYADFEKIPDYKALYVMGAAKSDIPTIDETLISVEKQFGGYGFYLPCATYHRLITGLTGNKMSSSKPESAIFLLDNPKDVKKKIMRSKTGGGVTVEEQRTKGGNPEICSVYELFLYHLIEDDNQLNKIYQSCKTGDRLCGKCKQEASDLMVNFLIHHQEKYNATEDKIDDYLST